jgi:uncharacterized protein YdhG (YjbR/CyaY superfamily)
MISKATTPQQYLDELPPGRKEAVTKLRNTIIKNLPKGFKEVMAYGMLGYVIPHEIYPAGYHCDPKLPLGFMNIASQKNFISFHHLGLYGSTDLLKWFVSEYPKHSPSKLDMGKGCVRFKKSEHIPYDLVAQLVKKVTVKDWIATYEKNLRR